MVTRMDVLAAFHQASCAKWIAATFDLAHPLHRVSHPNEKKDTVMATQKENMGFSRRPQHITEAQPNPHGEQEIAEMPVQTDHGAVTRENVGQNTSTRDNRMNPSVNGPLEDPTTDSMFNLADPQTREIEESAAKTKDESRRGAGNQRGKTPRKRKAA